jgi:ABC-2 type transport system permease protein
MNRSAILALIRNDLRIFRTDRRAVIIGIMVPILIAAFFGYVFGGASGGEAGKIPIVVVDEDQSSISKAIIADLGNESLVSVQSSDRSQAQARVRSGKAQVAAIIPRDFGHEATMALFSSQRRPRVELLIDPSQAMSGRVVEGLFAQHGMQEISREAFSGPLGQTVLSDYVQRLESDASAQHPETGDLRALLKALQQLNARSPSDGGTTSSGLRRGLTIPYEITTSKVTAAESIPYNGYAHSFAGMTTQFLLLAGIDAGVALLMTRERGIWQRLRSAPIAKADFLLARTMATTLIGLFQMFCIYSVAMLVFGVRIQGSIAGFLLLSLVFCLLNATFGLMLASLGRSVPATRGIAVMATLLLVMIGGAWVPAFVFPKWLQKASLAAPTRWAVDGFDAMTWRGLHFDAAVAPIAVLSLTAAICLGVAIFRFRWNE